MNILPVVNNKTHAVTRSVHEINAKSTTNFLFWYLALVALVLCHDQDRECTGFDRIHPRDSAGFHGGGGERRKHHRHPGRDAGQPNHDQRQ